MKKDITLVLVFSVVSTLGYSQAAIQKAVPQQMRAQHTLDRMAEGGVGSSDLLYGVPGAPGRLVGDFYLDKKWNRGSIMLIDTEAMIEGYPIKYDLKSHTVEILTKSSIKILDVKKVKSLVWLDSLTQRPTYFVNGADYKDEGTPLNGLLEVVADGQVPLFCRTTTWVKKATYVPALDVGSKDEVVNKRLTFYYSQGKDLIKISGKKKMLPAFGNLSEDVDHFIRANNLGVNDKKDLQRIFEYYNSKAAQSQP
jgi:hypothetical protein